MVKQVNGSQIIQLFEEFSPKKYAFEGDPIGLQVGSFQKSVNNIMIALDVLENVVDEAIEKEVDLIIAHHPMIFRPMKKIQTDQPQGRIVEKLLKHDITVYAAHTNLDIAKGGVNDMLAQALQLENTSVLVPTYEQKLRKLVVYVPVEQAEQVRAVLGEAGAGAIGEYSHCSFSTEGTGCFLPGEGTNPHIGEHGKLERVQEVRIETVYPVEFENKMISAMLKAHPYEEPAYDLYDLALKGEELGLGRIGQLKEEMSLQEFALFTKEVLDSPGVRVVGNLEDKVKKVAVLGGDGNKYFSHAKFKGADVYVTGDFYYHTAHDAMNMGLNIVDPGHTVEKIMKKGVAERLQHLCKSKNLAVHVFPSESDTNPFKFL
ncbi:Nif3-like dinuclear metal center hexameric protein [Lederbergia sp. NSJ-179]|uniref:Nif3-like dinuclear metal center hexameric protein n=1 Tax=Lederbergia sp. NSJ-179 TaxID=2931402 RepID=UPI001FD4BD21|nr:Nif3-like dinuclear metal center hexameric protein [Lederbergia sp. NSJ-179]MCJ7841860.1 Nif3-like dinuclear metal center hexameric protein [Lederbergia sp. NSJ-179]